MVTCAVHLYLYVCHCSEEFSSLPAMAVKCQLEESVDGGSVGENSAGELFELQYVCVCVGCEQFVCLSSLWGVRSNLCGVPSSVWGI